MSQSPFQPLWPPPRPPLPPRSVPGLRSSRLGSPRPPTPLLAASGAPGSPSETAPGRGRPAIPSRGGPSGAPEQGGHPWVGIMRGCWQLLALPWAALALQGPWTGAGTTAGVGSGRRDFGDDGERRDFGGRGPSGGGRLAGTSRPRRLARGRVRREGRRIPGWVSTTRAQPTPLGLGCFARSLSPAGSVGVGLRGGEGKGRVFR